jgi:hypothetical protein
MPILPVAFRLGRLRTLKALDLPRHLRRDPSGFVRQYTGPVLARPLVVSVHDVSYLEHPQYFTRFRSIQLGSRCGEHWSAPRGADASEFSPSQF